MNKFNDIITQRLLAPFPPNCYSFKPGAGSANSKIPLIAIDPRDVVHRLNQVFGFMNWSETNTVEVLHFDSDQKSIQSQSLPKEKLIMKATSTITVRLEDDKGKIYEFSRSDVGDEAIPVAQQNWCTTPSAQAFKRAAVKLGIGAYLYQLKFPSLAYADYKFTSIHNNPEAVTNLLNQKDRMQEALEIAGFWGICEETGQSVDWETAASSMHRFGRVLSKEGYKQSKSE